MRRRYFYDQAVGAQQRQLPGDGAGLASSLHLVQTLAVKGHAQIAIAEAVDEEVALSDGTQQDTVLAKLRVERTSHAPAFGVEYGTAQRFEELAQRRLFLDGGQAVGQAIDG